MEHRAQFPKLATILPQVGLTSCLALRQKSGDAQQRAGKTKGMKMKKEQKATASDYIPRLLARNVVEIKTGTQYTCLSDKRASELIAGGLYRRASEPEVMEVAEEMAQEKAAADSLKITRYTAAHCRKYIRRMTAHGLVEKSGKPDHIFQPLDPEEYAKRLASGEYRRPKLKEILENMDSVWGDDFRWWASTVESLQGGLAALRGLAESVESQTHDGIEDALAPHLDAIGAILDKAHKAYKESVRVIEKATA